MARTSEFAKKIISWQKRHGRHNLPWQNTRDPYRIWLSEIMLQQTQVASVIPYYRRFLRRFPTLGSLAMAKQDTVLSLWSGLGYYSRARNLHETAGIIMARFGSRFPHDFNAILDLPGIGLSTAGAISVFAFARPRPILDGNVRRVLCRHFKFPADAKQLWILAESLLPGRDIVAYTQGLMDLGSAVCTLKSPSCSTCPLDGSCKALKEGRLQEFPASVKKSRLPRRTSSFLIIGAGRRILLEKRPVPGIWGGLWCLPEVPDSGDPILYCKEHLGISVKRFRIMDIIKHSFTHFKLEMHVLAAQVRLRKNPAYEWMTREKSLKMGLPAPVRKILTVS